MTFPDKQLFCSLGFSPPADPLAPGGVPGRAFGRAATRLRDALGLRGDADPLALDGVPGGGRAVRLIGRAAPRGRDALGAR